MTRKHPLMDEVKMRTTKVSVVTLYRGHLLLYPSFDSNTQTYLSLDTLPYTQFRSGRILNSMDLIPTLVFKRQTKRLLQGYKQKKKRNKGTKALISPQSKPHHLCLL